MARILDFQNVLSCASSGVIHSVYISLRTPSIHLPLGLPLGLFPGTLMSPTALTSLFFSILCMCRYQQSHFSYFPLLNRNVFNKYLYYSQSQSSTAWNLVFLCCVPIISYKCLPLSDRPVKNISQFCSDKKHI